MINVEKAMNEFEKYAEKFNLEEIALKRKRAHSYRVMKISTQIAKKLEAEELNGIEFNEDDIQIATLIGLLHDIARFEQYTKYKTFTDKRSVDHGDFGIEILQTTQEDTGKKFIRNFIDTDKYDKIILKAIKNHNKYKIEEGLTDKENIFCKIIRDADKLDIFFETSEVFWKDDKSEVEDLKISPYIQEHLHEDSTIERRAEIKFNRLDTMISMIYFIFDLNYKESFKIMKDQNYINRIIDQFNFKYTETKEKMEEIREIANTYIKGRN